MNSCLKLQLEPRYALEKATSLQDILDPEEQV